MNWSPLGDQFYEGQIYGQKERAVDRYFTLPRDTGCPLELAVRAPEAVQELLVDGGWRLTDPMQVTQSPWSYQRYLQTSRAEFSVAKHGYVIARCGWFSERSAAYLASGRPVVIQDTGFSDWLPTGSGVLSFNTPEEAISGIEAIDARYHFHCQTARSLAEAYFDARRVLSDLLTSALDRSPISEGLQTHEARNA